MAGQPIPAQESFNDMVFPDRGVDLSQGFGMQLPGTTPVGQNVRVYEPTTLRGRGGARPGISKYILGQLPNGAKLIQHLNIIVDPSTTATLDNFDDTGDTVEDTSSDGPASSWATGFTTRNPLPHRFVRRGGHARSHNKQPRVKKTTIKFIQALMIGGTVPLLNITYPASVTKGSLLVVGICSNNSNPTYGVIDTQGNSYTEINHATGGTAGICLFYGFAGATGPNIVTATASGTSFMSAAALEYSGVDPLTPLDSSTANTSSGFTPDGTPWTTGMIGVSGSGELVIGTFGQGFEQNAAFTQKPGFNVRCKIENAALAQSMIVIDMLNVMASEEATVTAVTSPDGHTLYGAVGASFNPQGH